MSFSWNIEVFEELSSTQDLIKTYAMDGKPEGCFVQALKQTKGRGRHGREWLMEEGNLALSFLLRPDCETQFLGQISILIGVALARSVGEHAVLKWPNDVMINEQKCAGILLESELTGSHVDWVAVGVGVNTHSAPENAAALNVDRDKFRDLLLDNIGSLYTAWQKDGFEDIRQSWLSSTYPKGTVLNIGVFEDLDENGNLIVRDEQNKLKPFSSGDVYLKEDRYAAGN